jgi:hypothetical protein
MKATIKKTLLFAITVALALSAVLPMTALAAKSTQGSKDNTAKEKYAQQYTEAGVYGDESVLVIKGDVLISAAGVTLVNMVIEGDLVLAKGINGGKVTLIDVYVKGQMILQDSVELDNQSGKIAHLGKPSDIAGRLFRENYPKADVADIGKFLDDLISQVDNAIYAN